MSAFKKLMFGFTLSLLSFLLFFLASFFALRQTVLNENYIKATMNSSGVYNNSVEAMVILAGANIATAPGQGGQIELAKLTPVIKQSITPEFLQSATEQVIGGTFNWLRGETPQPAFAVNTGEVKRTLSANTTSFLQAQLATLPVCPQGTAYVNFNPLTATCRPSFAVSQSELESYANQFTGSLPLGKTDTVGFNDIAININQTALTAPPKVYQAFNWLPFAITAAIAALIIIDIMVVRNHRLAVQKIGHSLVWAGSFLVVSGIVVLVFIQSFGANKLINTPTAAQANFVSQTIAPIGEAVSKSLANYAIYFGVGYAILGAAFYFWAHTMHINQIKQQPEKADTLSTDKPKTI